MELSKLLSTVDHTLLAPDSSWEQIKAVCDDGIKYKTASVCIPAHFVKRAKAYVNGGVKICTVVGFPCGYSKSEAKAKETELAIADGADEIDMVINIGMLKDGDLDGVLADIVAVRKACPNNVLKVIIETGLLTDDQKIAMCDIVAKSGADFIKTSTGFFGTGATFADIELFKKHCPKTLGIKAAGGISSLDDGYKFLELGATRLGTSRIIKIIKNENSGGY